MRRLFARVSTKFALALTLVFASACAAWSQCGPANIDSPGGKVAAGSEIKSADCRFVIRLKPPGDTGNYSILDTKTNQEREIQVSLISPNDAKAVSISTDSKVLAVHYHDGPGGWIQFYHVETGRPLKRQAVNAWFHHMRFLTPNVLELRETGGKPISITLEFPQP